MQLLEDKILSEGRVLPGSILKVDSFLNHQIDAELMAKVGEEFAEYFKDKNITRVVTVESSGIAPAVFTALHLGVPVVFARKKLSLTLNDGLVTTEVNSYTKGEKNTIAVSRDYIKPKDNILIIDDFLAKGEVIRGLIDITKQIGANIAGVGIVIEKAFQNGRKYVEEENIPILSLVRIESLEDNKIKLLK